jgi:uncharacterized protein YjbI with pentapeptide repeats
MLRLEYSLRCYNARMIDPNRQIERKSKLSEQGNEGDESLHVVPDVFVELVASSFRSAESYAERRVVGSLAGTTADEVQFENGCFASVDLSNSRWHKLLLWHTRLEKCDLANARWANATLETVEMQKCRGTGFQFVDSRSFNSTFVASKFNLAAFHGSKFHHNRFEECDLREANFESADLKEVVFRNCDLRLARFPNCSLGSVDFRGSQLTGIQLDPDQLRGACVDIAQFADLATTFGLVVKALDADECDAASVEEVDR